MYPAALHREFSPKHSIRRKFLEVEFSKSKQRYSTNSQKVGTETELKSGTDLP